MSVEPHLLPTHSEAIFNSMQAERAVTRIAFNPSTANPGDVFLRHGTKARSRCGHCA